MSVRSTVAGVQTERLAELESGTVAVRTLTEALAINQSRLLSNVIPDAPVALIDAVSAASGLGILARMSAIGTALRTHLDETARVELAAHPSDTVRGWVCFAIASSTNADAPATLLSELRGVADDEHFAVREWAWMAARPTLTARLTDSITLLTGWTDDESERIRRFASESLRPRGVWAKHIPELKADPGQALPILEPLRSDQSRYVQDSVGNWINDAAKTRPDWVAELCARWREESPTAQTERITTRALRSL